MSSDNINQQDSLFQTPDPAKLKKETEQGLIREQYSAPEAKVNDEQSENKESDLTNSYFEGEEERAPSSSPIINANLSGG